MSKQVLKQVSPHTSVWVDKENKKQTSIDFLIEQIEIILKLNNVKLDPEYTFHTILPIIEKLKAMHKEEMFEYIKQKYCIGQMSLEFHTLEFEQYYNETFGGDK